MWSACLIPLQMVKHHYMYLQLLLRIAEFHLQHLFHLNHCHHCRLDSIWLIWLDDGHKYFAQIKTVSPYSLFAKNSKYQSLFELELLQNHAVEFAIAITNCENEEFWLFCERWNTHQNMERSLAASSTVAMNFLHIPLSLQTEDDLGDLAELPK